MIYSFCHREAQVVYDTMDFVRLLPLLCDKISDPKQADFLIRNAMSRKAQICPHGITPKRNCVDCNRERNRILSRKKRQENREAELERGRINSRKWRQSHTEKSRENTRLWRLANPDKAKDGSRRWRKENPGKAKESLRRWVEANREKVREDMRQWVENNREKKREYFRLWKKENPEKVQQYTCAGNQNRRARIKNSGGRFTALDWQELKQNYNYACLCCGRREPEIKLTPDHVKPLAKGGSNSIDNIQPLCLSCNNKKHAKEIDYRS